MFDVFESRLPRDSTQATAGPLPQDFSALPPARKIIEKFGGSSFAGGLYRIVSSKNYDEWMERVTFAFPKSDNLSSCFGYDWQGNAYALNSKKLVKGQPGVIFLDVGFAEAYELPVNIEDFHNKLIFEDDHEILVAPFFKKWLSAGGARAAYDECIGYKVPPCFGGDEKVKNLEVSDLDVYWHVLGQAMRQRIWFK